MGELLRILASPYRVIKSVIVLAREFVWA